MRLVARFVPLVLFCSALVAFTPPTVAQNRPSPVAVGEMAPDFTLESHRGTKVTLSEAREKSPVVLVFYRGYWWPYCARQLAALRTLLKKGENVQLYAISIDPPDMSKKLTEKIAADGQGPIDFSLLSDPGHKIIDMYGLLDPSYKGQDVYGIPHPAVYVIDKSGRVSWVKIESNYRERPVNAEIRTALDAIK